MIHALTPWRLLTRNGIPAFKVMRRPLALGEVTLPVGAALDPELIPHHIRDRRLRQFYEQHRLEPVEPQPDTQQYYRERFERLHGGGAQPIEPITPVATRVVADSITEGTFLAGVPSVDVPVAEEPPRPKPKGKR